MNQLRQYGTMGLWWRPVRSSGRHPSTPVALGLDKVCCSTSYCCWAAGSFPRRIRIPQYKIILAKRQIWSAFRQTWTRRYLISHKHKPAARKSAAVPPRQAFSVRPAWQPPINMQRDVVVKLPGDAHISHQLCEELGAPNN